ncbi:hypothetical protein niasHS_010930 [Heterodera schachtii]|uniref:DUF7153 domain-containing protein n=1 Tax=Heterodera schachtii TaxID=97005 RepID=A0ABD2IU43_HETSC
MNLVLETFERVLYPSGGAASRRASASGVSAKQQRPQIADSRQMAIGGGRRRSGGSANIPSQFARAGSPLVMASASSAGANCVAVNDYPALKGSTTERGRKRRETNGGEAEAGGTKAQNDGRSRSGARRKKSGGSHPRKQSMVSLLFAAISSSAPSVQNRRRNRLPPPRQLSVPERGSLMDPNSEDEPFRLVQKAPSVTVSASSSYSNQRTPPTNRMSRECLSGSQTDGMPPSGHSQFVLFGFAFGPRSSSFNRFSSNHSPPFSESHFLAQIDPIRQCPSLSRALLLRCVDPEPLYPFLHCATFDSGETSAEMAEEMNRMSAGKAEFVSFEEVIALERPAAGDNGFGTSPASVPPSLASTIHSGFIVLCFRLLDGQTGSNSQLENTWLSWTGANEIYKYSPRSWQLRRLSFLRRVPFSAVRSFPSSSPCPSSPFAFSYLLICEFGSILHPNNAVGALDMCERLRTRNCGTVSLYQVRHRFATPSNVSAFSSSSPFDGHFSSPTMANSLSPHWSPQQIRRNTAVHRLNRMGYSQEVPDRANGMAQRRSTLLRMRERSLGWDGERAGTAL